jgi:hypothetical protein
MDSDMSRDEVTRPERQERSEMSEHDPQKTNDDQPTGPVPDAMQVPADEPPIPASPPPSRASAVPPQPEPPQVTRELPPAYGPQGWAAADQAAYPGGPPVTYPGTGQSGYSEAGQPGYPASGYGPYPGSVGGDGGAGAPPVGPPSGYQAYAYGYPAQPARTDDKAIWALVSSIAGFILCPVVLHVVGWVLANQSLRSIRESRGALTGDGVAKAARILGIVGVAFYSLLAVAAIAFALILIPIGLVAGSAATTSFDVGSQTTTPTEVSEIDGRAFTHDVGDVTYDLTDLDFGGETVEMSVDLGAGTLVVEVPDEVTVNLEATVGAGQIDAFGKATSGVSLTRNETSTGEPGGGSVLLDLDVDLGDLRVVQN